MPAEAAEPVKSVFPQLEALLPHVQKPIQYVGGELNSTVKEWESCDVRWALMYPRRVRGRSAQPGRHDPLRGAQRAAGRPGRAHLQRVAGPGGADAGALRPAVHRRQPPPGAGLRRLRPLLLHGAGLHQHADRPGPGRHPAGVQGPRHRRPGRPGRRTHAAFNPEPIADFIDCAVIGDGEQAVLEITAIIRAWKAEAAPAAARNSSSRLARTGGVYVPGFYDVEYLPDGRIARVVPNRSGVPWRVSKHTVMDLDGWPYPQAAPRPPRRDRPRAHVGGDLPRLHPRLPLLPGRHDHPPGARAFHHRHRRHGREGPEGNGLRRGRPPVPLLRRPLGDRRRRQGPRGPVRGGQDRPVPPPPASTPSTSTWPTS